MFGTKITQSRAKHHSLEERGFIRSKQTGQTETKVWLIMIPQEIKTVNDDTTPNHINMVLKPKVEGIGALNGVLIPSLITFLDDNNPQKSMGNGDIGDRGAKGIRKLVLKKLEKL